MGQIKEKKIQLFLLSLTQLHNRIIAGHPPACPRISPERGPPGRSREPPDFCFVIILSRSPFSVLWLMAARASPAAHAETKLLMGPNNGPVEKGRLKAVSQ